MTTIKLKNVILVDGGFKDIEVSVVPFNIRNDDHVHFVFSYTDMMQGLPSIYKNINDAATDYVNMFMAHTEEDTKNKESDFCLVRRDLRACRTLFNNPGIQIAINDFFENA